MEEMNLNGDSYTILRGLETLRSVLTEIGWEPQQDEDGTGFFIDFEPPYIPVAQAYAAISSQLEMLVIYFNFGVAAAPERRNETARLLTLINWNLAIGNFEIDFEDGLVRFRSSLCFRGTELSDALIRNIIRFAMSAVERYANGIIEVMARDKSADKAFRETLTHEDSAPQ